MTADRDDLAAILAKHESVGNGCVCGVIYPAYRVTRPFKGTYSAFNEPAHRAHVAQMVLESDWLRGVKAQAAQDERDRMLKPWPGEWVIHDGCDDAPKVRHYHVGDRCPYRADRVDAEDGGRCVCGHNEHGRVCFQECQDNTTDRT